MWEIVFTHPNGGCALRVRYSPLWDTYSYEQFSSNGLLINQWTQQRTDLASGDSLITKRYES